METSWVARRAGRRFRYRKRSRTVAEQALESYLRVDIPCGSEACPACAPTLPSLSATAPHYMIPDGRLLEDFLELFEVPEVSNVVYLSSVMRPLLEGGNMRRSAKLRTLYSDKRRRCYLFDNLHQLDTAVSAGPAEAACGGDLLAAADWYYEHLGGRLPIVVVSDSLAARLGAVPESSGSSGASAGTATASAAAAGAAPPAASPAQHASSAGDEEQDAELEALLRSMDINPAASSAGPGGGWAGGGWGASAPAGRAADDSNDTLAFLDSLSLDQQPSAPAAASPAAAAAAAVPEARGPLAPGVHVLSAAQYFSRFYGDAPSVWDVYESKAQSLAEEAVAAGSAGAAQAAGGGGGGGYKPHLSAAAVEAGASRGELLQGVLSISRRARQEGTVRVGGGEAVGGARHVLVVGRAALNRAMHGDTVAVRLLPRERWRPAALAADADADDDVISGEADLAGGEEEAGDATAEELLNNSAGGSAQPTGEVVAILQRGAGEIVATIAEEDERALLAKQDVGRQEAVLCIPLDRRLPKVRLRSRQLHRMLGARLVVRIDGWEPGSNYPHGHLLRVLGPVNDLTAETDAVLVSSGVHWEPFTEGALRELPQVSSPEDWAVPPGELAARRDLRGSEHFVCSIDPPGCTDVDDALSVRWVGSGCVEVGVHIADVSHFVRQGSLLDAEAASRCTTVYLVDRRLDMLPALLSEQLCSLRGGRDRLAVSVLWTLREEDLAVQSAWFGRTVIRSRYQLEYQQAQDIMEGAPPRPGHEIAAADRPTLQRALRFLARLAAARREGRLQEGAVELESAELRFKTNAEGQPTHVDVKQEIPMMRIVAEMMIFANAAVGERIYRAFPRAALLRRHPPPRREAFGEVLPLCESVGVELDFSSNAALSAGLEAAAAAAPPAVATLIKSLTTRAMSEAEYFCTGDVMGRGAGMSHFGLALPFYTHFTSPIRRYADVVVHRQLLAAVAAGGHTVQGAELQPPPDAALLLQQAPPPLPPAAVSSRAGVMNERHRTAKRAQKDCSDLYLLLLLHSQPHVEAATVYGFRGGSALLVFVPKYHLKGVVHLTDTAGIAKPPLRRPGDEDLSDPFVLAYRRGIAVVPGEKGMSLVDAATGAVVAEYRALQRVWVELGADGSRAHGPAMRMRLLADSHPAVLEALRQGRATELEERPVAPAQLAKQQQQQQQQAEQGCGALPRGMPGSGGYRPPGLFAGGAPSTRRPPPGFPAPAGEPAVANFLAGRQQQQQQQQMGESSVWTSARVEGQDGSSTALPAPQYGKGAQEPGALAGEEALRPVGTLHIAAPRTVVDAAGAGPPATGGAATTAAAAEALAAAVRRLRARVSRYALRAAGGDPAGRRAQEWEGKAAGCRAQLAELERLLVACR